MYGSDQVVIYECTEKEKHVPNILKVNLMNAPEKIGDYPESIQKLVWRALHYKCEIDARQVMDSRAYYNNCEKLTNYVEAFRHTQQLIIKMCKRHNLKWVIIEENSIDAENQSEKRERQNDTQERIDVEYFLQCPRCGGQLRQNPIEKEQPMIVLDCYCENCDKYYIFHLDLFGSEYY